MDRRVVFELPDYSIEQIKRDYHLYSLCIDDTAQIENIAITIQSIYLYHNVLMGLPKWPRSMEASLCRTMLIMSYSVLEGIVVSTGYKIQDRCRSCPHKCGSYCDSMFQGDRKKNEKDAFFNADGFLKNAEILAMDASASKYYKTFRDSRNNVHLARNARIITEDPMYSISECAFAVKLLQKMIDVIYHNYLAFCERNNCER